MSSQQQSASASRPRSGRGTRPGNAEPAASDSTSLSLPPQRKRQRTDGPGMINKILVTVNELVAGGLSEDWVVTFHCDRSVTHSSPLPDASNRARGSDDDKDDDGVVQPDDFELQLELDKAVRGSSDTSC